MARLSNGFEGLLPADIEVEQTTGDLSEESLFPAERDFIAGAVAKRRAEFATTRACARRALGRLGYPEQPLLPGAHREPVWPWGVIGSLTHCEGYRAVAVAQIGKIDSVITIGIDAEIHESLPEGVADFVTVGGERTHLERLHAEVPGIFWDRILFSAKESIFKAWFPLARKWLDFTECELRIDTAGGFTGQLLVPGPDVGGRKIESFNGRWAVEQDHILTAVWE